MAIHFSSSGHGVTVEMVSQLADYRPKSPNRRDKQLPGLSEMAVTACPKRLEISLGDCLLSKEIYLELQQDLLPSL